MTIDEAIAHARKNYNDIINTTYNKCQYEHLSCEGCATPTCKEIADENLQIAEWLEDYKRIKMLIPIEQALKNEYNKAIDDLMKKVSECFISDADWNYLLQESERLKAGASNGTDNQ